MTIEVPRPARAAAALLFAVLVLAVAAPAVPAQSLTYGDACSGVLPAPQISFSGSVVPGQNAAISVAGAPPFGFVVLHIGTTATELDLSADPWVADGCFLLAAPDIALILLQAGPDGSLTVPFKMTGAFGSDLYFQWAVVEEPLLPSVTLTQGVRVSVKDGPYLHVVLLADELVVDWDQDGKELVTLDGTDSHTHEIGHELAGWSWTLDGEQVATTALAQVEVPVGTHELALTISDDHSPAHTLMQTTTITVVSPTEVPGVMARHHDAAGGDPALLLDAVPPTADWSETLDTLRVEDGGGTVGSSPFAADVMVVLTGAMELADADDYEFVAVGGSDTRLFVDGAPVAAPLALAAGVHTVEARFAVETLADLPLAVHLGQGGAPPTAIDGALLTHDVTSLGPVLHGLVPDSGSAAGGNVVVLEGSGFAPALNVSVDWGGTPLTLGQGLSIEPGAITLSTPSGPVGPIAVTVTAPTGTSNTETFTYVDTGPVPDFAVTDSTRVHLPTSAAWGPDGRLYVTSLDGELRALSFDDDLAITAVDTYAGVSGLVNHNALGVTVNPFDDASPVRLYVSHGLLYADGGGEVVSPSAYHGQVSVLTGPDFDDPVPLVTGLPQSNSGHAVNGLQFDHNGDLLLMVGCNTNGGVPDLAMGTLPESPLSGAALKAETSRADFDGAVSYVFTAGGAPSTDQRDGHLVDVAPGSHVSVHAPGIRNPYDLVYTTSGRLYGTDNGPNQGFGPGSTGPASDTGYHVAAPDELLLVEAGVYYGSANRNRGRTDPRQDVYRDPWIPSLPGEFRQALTLLPSSTDGIDEYRADTFDGQMRGQLLVQKWNDGAQRIALAEDGRSVTGTVALTPASTALDIVHAPGGAIVQVDHSASTVKILSPVEPAGGMEVLDVFPWRAPATGGMPFVLGGRGFGSIGDTTVTVGGLPALVTEVSPTRIRGTLPAQPSPTTERLDIVVDSGGEVDTLSAAFRTLFVPVGSEPGRWETLPTMPVSLGEVAGGIIDGRLYVVGEGDPSTQVYDVVGGQWLAPGAPRPFPGHHHAAEVLGGKLYLFGGLTAGSNGRVQVYDPVADLWSEGAPMPWSPGSAASAVIDGKVYVAGGIVSNQTVANAGVYDPAADAWTVLPPMPVGRNHAAGGSDGERFWVFGGRDKGNWVTNGFDDVQVYDPATGTWAWDKDGVSTLAPMPIGRGGMGGAVFWQGEFFVMGGETSTGPGATDDDVYERVDVYDPETDLWRLDAPLPTPRHGILPVLFESRMFVAGGGVKKGNSQSGVSEVFTRQ